MQNCWTERASSSAVGSPIGMPKVPRHAPGFRPMQSETIRTSNGVGGIKTPDLEACSPFVKIRTIANTYRDLYASSDGGHPKSNRVPDEVVSLKVEQLNGQIRHRAHAMVWGPHDRIVWA